MEDSDDDDVFSKPFAEFMTSLRSTSDYYCNSSEEERDHYHSQALVYDEVRGINEFVISIENESMTEQLQTVSECCESFSISGVDVSVVEDSFAYIPFQSSSEQVIDMISCNGEMYGNGVTGTSTSFDVMSECLISFEEPDLTVLPNILNKFSPGLDEMMRVREEISAMSFEESLYLLHCQVTSEERQSMHAEDLSARRRRSCLLREFGTLSEQDARSARWRVELRSESNELSIMRLDDEFSQSFSELLRNRSMMQCEDFLSISVRQAKYDLRGVLLGDKESINFRRHSNFIRENACMQKEHVRSHEFQVFFRESLRMCLIDMEAQKMRNFLEKYSILITTMLKTKSSSDSYGNLLRRAKVLIKSLECFAVKMKAKKFLATIKISSNYRGYNTRKRLAKYLNMEKETEEVMLPEVDVSFLNSIPDFFTCELEISREISDSIQAPCISPVSETKWNFSNEVTRNLFKNARKHLRRGTRV